VISLTRRTISSATFRGVRAINSRAPGVPKDELAIISSILSTYRLRRNFTKSLYHVLGASPAAFRPFGWGRFMAASSMGPKSPFTDFLPFGGRWDRNGFTSPCTRHTGRIGTVLVVTRAMFPGELTDQPAYGTFPFARFRPHLPTSFALRHGHYITAFIPRSVSTNSSSAPGHLSTSESRGGLSRRWRPVWKYPRR
jgi:hypothetical protein